MLNMASTTENDAVNGEGGSKRTSLAVSSANTSKSVAKGKIIQQPILALEDDDGGSEEDSRNWKGIFIALCVILTVFGFVVLSVFLVTPVEGEDAWGRTRFTLRDILSDEFSPISMNGSWVSDREFSLIFDDGMISKLDVVTLANTVLMPKGRIRELGHVVVHNFKVSADGKHILLSYDAVKLRRYSWLAKYATYSVDSGELKAQLIDPKEETPSEMQFATWAPRGNALAFVYKNNIYYKKSVSSHEISRLTTTGIEGVVFNGVPDWIYEKEILLTDHALLFNQNASLLLYMTFNDSGVKELVVPSYRTTDHEEGSTGSIKKIRYPRPGTPNPVVTLHVVSVATRQTWTVIPPNTLKNIEHYITTFTWVDNDTVSVVWMNRAQNMALVSVCSFPKWTCEELHAERPLEKGWVDFYIPPIFSGDGSEALIVSQVTDEDFGFFRHVTHIDVQSKRVRPITYGQFEVTTILGWNQDKHVIYYVANTNENPGLRHLYQVGDLTSSSIRMTKCLTCFEEISFADRNVSRSEFEPCLYNQPTFSSDLKHVVIECLGPNVPHIDLFEVSDGQLIWVTRLQNNTVLKETLARKVFPRVKTLDLKLSGNFRARVRLFYPPGVADRKGVQVPLILQSYDGPGTQMVSEQWQLHWGQYLASNKEIIVAWYDGKGTGFQGNRMQYEVYYRLGSVEVHDQMEVLKLLIKKFSFIDPKNVAVWGWGYGGYLATSALITDKDDVFKCGLAVSPITDWFAYNSVFTERYMGSPVITDNQWGYRQSDVTKKAAHMRGKLYFLIHGTADDDVPLEHSMILTDSLVKAGVLFKQMVYAGQNHDLSGVKFHLHESMESFLDDCFWNSANSYAFETVDKDYSTQTKKGKG